MTRKNAPFIAQIDDEGKRIDRVLRRLFPGLPLSAVYRILRRGRVRINGKRADMDYRLRSGDNVEIDDAQLPSVFINDANLHSPATQVMRDRLEKLVLFQNEHVLAINKPYGMLVHGKNSLAELVNAVQRYDQPRSLSFRPGPAHRLDRNTTGIQLFSLSLFGARTLAKLFREQFVMKIYCALVDGIVTDPGEWTDWISRDSLKKKTVQGVPISGRRAITRVLPFASANNYSLVLFLPETGRTHQIRCQSALHGHPLAGDRKYGGSPSLRRYLLHNLGMAIDSSELIFAPLVAPFDGFEEDLVTDKFGKQATFDVYAEAKKLLGL